MLLLMSACNSLAVDVWFGSPNIAEIRMHDLHGVWSAVVLFIHTMACLSFGRWSNSSRWMRTSD